MLTPFLALRCLVYANLQQGCGRYSVQGKVLWYCLRLFASVAAPETCDDAVLSEYLILCPGSICCGFIKLSSPWPKASRLAGLAAEHFRLAPSTGQGGDIRWSVCDQTGGTVPLFGRSKRSPGGCKSPAPILFRGGWCGHTGWTIPAYGRKLNDFGHLCLSLKIALTPAACIT